MTVSRFLRSPSLVAPDTGSRISKALSTTGYIPNLQAGSLASGRSHAVAVLVPNIAHSIFADTLHGLGEGLQQAGLQMLVSATGYSLSQEAQQVRNVLGWAPAALVVTGRTHLPETTSLLISSHQRGTPVVEIWDQCPINESPMFHQIGFKHFDTGIQMAAALIERGYRCFAFVDSAVSEDFRAHERGLGFVDECQRRGFPVDHLVAEPGDPIEQGGACFEQWFTRPNSASIRRGMAFANDLLATGALLRSHAMRCRIPEDLALLGFGDFPLARHCLGGLSTMQIQGEKIGMVCAQHIASSLNPGFDALKCHLPAHTLQPKLLWRAT